MNQVLESIQRHVIVGDYIKFQLEADADSRLGEIIHCQQQTVKVRLFKVMDLATLERFFIAPITSQECPLTSQDEMVEVYQMNTEISFNCSSIVDIAFIVSLQEVESGMFYISGEPSLRRLH